MSKMSEKYEFFDHTADIGVHVYGATLPELFINAAQAIYEVMGSLAKGKDRRENSMKLEDQTLENLLHDWLTELLYEVDANRVLYDEFEFVQLDATRLTAIIRGGPIDFARSEPRDEIKAVTYHQLCVEQTTNGRWRATVIFDV